MEVLVVYYSPQWHALLAKNRNADLTENEAVLENWITKIYGEIR